MEHFNNEKAIPNPETIAAMNEAVAIAEDDSAKKFNSVEELMTDLNSED